MHSMQYQFHWSIIVREGKEIKTISFVKYNEAIKYARENGIVLLKVKANEYNKRYKK